MNKSVITLFLAIFSSSAILVSCGTSTSKNAAAAADPNAIKDYKTLTIEPREAVLTSDFPATIEGEQTVEIRPRVDGNIERIYVSEGALVSKGQVLFQINGDLFEQQVRSAAATVGIAQANVNAARMQVNKVKPLVDKDIISKYELESAQYSLQSMQASLAQAKAALSNAKTNLSYTYVKSPANGVIGRIPYKIGALVSSNITEPLTTVANVSKVYAYFSMNEKQLLEFSRTTGGATLQAKFASLPPVQLILSDGTVYPQTGKIETASGLINTATGSTSIKASFSNSAGILRSGGTGRVRIPVTINDALMVPQSATYEIQGRRFVYVVGDSAKVKSVAVKVNSSAAGQAFVVQEGIKAGDQIVIEGVAALREGAKIKPVTVNADSVYTTEKL